MSGTERRELWAERVIEAADHVTAERPTLGLSVGPLEAQLRFSNAELEAAVVPAIRHLVVSDSPGSTRLLCWRGPDWVIEEAPWNAARIWGDRENLHVRTNGYEVAFEPWSRVITVHDRRRDVVVAWFPESSSLTLSQQAGPFVSALNWLLAERGVAVCHSGAVGTVGVAVLLPGKGGSGKSTTSTSAAAAGGLGILGDDFIAVETGDAPIVRSLYRTAKLEPETMARVFPGARGYRTQADDDPRLVAKGLVYLDDVAPGSHLVSAPLGAIVVPNVAHSPEPSLERIPPSEALFALSASSVAQMPGDSRRTYGMLATLVRTVPSFRLDLSPDLATNAVVLREFCEALP